jgi:hypothetical protein
MRRTKGHGERQRVSVRLVCSDFIFQMTDRTLLVLLYPFPLTACQGLLQVSSGKMLKLLSLLAVACSASEVRPHSREGGVSGERDLYVNIFIH